jgi:competence protein ComEC
LKWPLAPWVICLAAGIVTADVWRHPIAWPYALLVALLVVWWLRRDTQRYLPWLACFALGWTTQVLHTTIYSPNDLRVVLNDSTELAIVEGRVNSALNLKKVEGQQGIKMHFTTTMSVTRVRYAGEWHDVAGEIFVQALTAPPEGLRLNSTAQVTGVLARPDEAAAPGLFDFRQYLARQNVHYQLRTSKPEDWQLPANSSAAAPWTTRFHAWAMRTLQYGLPPGDTEVMLVQAMALGWKGGLMNDVSEPFIRTGTMHVFAISGLHVALIALALVALLRAFNAPRILCGALMLPLLWFYTAATGWQASAIRATIMATVIGAGWMLERPSNMLNSLAASALLILLLDPQQLFQAGFQLSFIVVLSLGLLTPPIEVWRAKLFHPDPFLPEELRPRWQRWLDWPVRFVTINFVTSLAAWLGSLPLIAYYFHIVTPVSLLANLVLVPLSSLALMANVGSLLTFWCPPVLELFNLAAWGLMRHMVWWSEVFAHPPEGWWYVATPGLLVVTLYYVMLFPAFAVEWKSPWRWRIAGTAGLALAIVFTHGWWEQRNKVELTILDVGGGDAHWFAGGLKHPSLLIDTGSADAFDFALKPFLQSQGVNHVPDLLLTHGDVRHVGGATNVAEEFHVERLITSPLPSRSPGYKRVVADWAKERLLVSAGTNLGPWQVLHPRATDKFSAGDDNAVVLRGDFNGVRVLLLSDFGRPGQRALLERETDLRADIVVTGIPTKEEPVNDELLAAIQPQIVIVTSAWHPALEQASKELMARLKSGPWKSLFVHECGTVTLRFREEGCEVKVTRGQSTFTVTPKPVR